MKISLEWYCGTRNLLFYEGGRVYVHFIFAEIDNTFVIILRSIVELFYKQ